MSLIIGFLLISDYNKNNVSQNEYKKDENPSLVLKEVFKTR
jgi:hypothetical protein